MATDTNNDRQWHWRNFWICAMISMGQLAFGYPASIISTTLSQPAFLEYMKLVDTNGLTANANQLIGATSGVFQAGAIFGVLLVSWIMDKWGRKAGVIYCATLSIIGGAMLCAAQNIAMFIVFRFFAGAGAWGFLALTPVYTAELAPSKLRGLFVGMNGVCIGTGYSIASYMGLAFYSQTDPTTQWRGPLGLALIFPCIMLIVIMIVPESPRWLCMVNRTEEACKIVMKLHGVQGHPDQEYARAEFYQMQKQAEFDKTLEPSWKELFLRPSYRRRMIIGCGFAIVGQSTAILVVNNYGPMLYEALGYGVRDRLILQCGWSTVAIPLNMVGAGFMDRFGRKPLMALGVAGCCVTLIIETAMIAAFASPIPSNPNFAGLRVGVAALYLFIAAYCLGVELGGVVYFSELFPNHMRAKGVAASIATMALTDLVYLQVMTTAFANIGWKYFLVFIIISSLGTVWIILALPETKGLPLEEIAAIFGDTEDIMVYSADIHINHTTHQLEVGAHNADEAGGEHVGTVAMEPNNIKLSGVRLEVAHIEDA